MLSLDEIITIDCLYHVFDYLSDLDLVRYHLLNKKLDAVLPNKKRLNKIFPILIKRRNSLRTYREVYHKLRSQTDYPYGVQVTTYLGKYEVVSSEERAIALMEDVHRLINFALRQAVAPMCSKVIRMSDVDSYFQSGIPNTWFGRWYRDPCGKTQGFLRYAFCQGAGCERYRAVRGQTLWYNPF